MPKEFTHWMLAERTLAGLDVNSRLHELLRTHHALYLTGAVLPDTLLHIFYGPHSPAALRLAQQFHDTSGNSFAPLIRYEQADRDELTPPRLACVLGVISHMLADIVFHPFVYYHGGGQDMGRHYRTETAIDLYFIRQGAIPPLQHLKSLLNREKTGETVAVCARIFDPDHLLPIQSHEQGLALHSRIQGMYCSGFWNRVARLLALLPVPLFKQAQHLFYRVVAAGDDALFFADAWRHPVSGDPRSQSLDELAETAVERTLTLFRRIEESGSLAAALTEMPGENLLTGLHGVTQSAMQHFREP